MNDETGCLEKIYYFHELQTALERLHELEREIEENERLQKQQEEEVRSDGKLLEDVFCSDCAVCLCARNQTLTSRLIFKKEYVSFNGPLNFFDKNTY